MCSSCIHQLVLLLGKLKGYKLDKTFYERAQHFYSTTSLSMISPLVLRMSSTGHKTEYMVLLIGLIYILGEKLL